MRPRKRLGLALGGAREDSLAQMEETLAELISTETAAPRRSSRSNGKRRPGLAIVAVPLFELQEEPAPSVRSGAGASLPVGFLCIAKISVAGPQYCRAHPLG
jgi:hypothetical protein